MRRWQKIWVEQCDAATIIRQRYGPTAAFDYLVGEKLLHFADAAAERPEFARELPRFVTRVRELFTPHQIRSQLARIERDLKRAAARIDDDDAVTSDTRHAARAGRFALLKELLTAAQLGTS